MVAKKKATKAKGKAKAKPAVKAKKSKVVKTASKKRDKFGRFK